MSRHGVWNTVGPCETSCEKWIRFKNQTLSFWIVWRRSTPSHFHEDEDEDDDGDGDGDGDGNEAKESRVKKEI